MRNPVLDSLFASPAEYPGIARIPDDLIYLMNCSGFSQFCCTLRGMIDHKTFCPFCRAEMSRRKRTKLYETDHWMLLQNEFVQKGVENMLLIIPKRHIEEPTFDDYDWSNIGAIFEIARAEHGMQDGIMLMRYGSVRHHAGTIKHAHINITRPVPGVEHRPTAAKNDTGPEGTWTHQRDYSQFLGFRQALQERGGRDWLLSREGIEETQPKAA